MKKNIRKIPPRILNKLEMLNAEVVVSCVQILDASETINFKHLDFYFDSDTLKYPESKIPNENQGKYSKINVLGEEIVRKDLPKEQHTRSMDVPNWGGSYNGTHTIDMPYEKYPRDYISPKHASIKISLDAERSTNSTYVLKFEIDTILNKKDDNFKSDLLSLLNIMQENIGDCDVNNTNTSFSKYLSTIKLSWDLLPLGNRDEFIKRLTKNNTIKQKDINVIKDRYDFFESLNPENLIYGTSGLQRYFGALINNNLVIFENVRYGNAIYIMFSDWKKLSKKSRTELISGRYGSDFERVIHTNDWKGKVRKIVSSKVDL